MPKLEMITTAAAVSEKRKNLLSWYFVSTKLVIAINVGPAARAGLLYPREIEVVQAVSNASEKTLLCIKSRRLVNAKTVTPANSPQRKKEVCIRMPNQRLTAVSKSGPK